MSFKNKQKEKEYYEYQASQFALINNIRYYKVEGRYMIYNVSYTKALGLRGNTVQYKIDLHTMQIETIKPLKKFDRNAIYNEPPSV